MHVQRPGGCGSRPRAHPGPPQGERAQAGPMAAVAGAAPVGQSEARCGSASLPLGWQAGLSVPVAWTLVRTLSMGDAGKLEQGLA